MNVTVYGDFNSLLSYLASQRADWLVRTARRRSTGGPWSTAARCRSLASGQTQATRAGNGS